MTMPTMADTFRFIFRHDEWLKNQQAKWEIANFIETVDFIANRHYTQNVPAVAIIKQRAAQIVRERMRQYYYDGLDISRLITDDREGKSVRVHEALFGRAIPLGELYDWVTRDRGHAVKITVNDSGMTVSTSQKHTISMPACEIRLNRLAEDGLRYRNACRLIDYVTDGAVKLDPAELVNKTENITVELIDNEWVVDTGIPTTS